MTTQIKDRTIRSLIVTVAIATPCWGQPYISGQNWQAGVGVNGGNLTMNTDADPQSETYPIIPNVLRDNVGNVQFMLSPDGSVVYARAFGSALTGACSSGQAQVYMFAVVQDTDDGGHLETILGGGLCLNDGLPDHVGLYEMPGQFQHVAYFVEAKDSPGATRQRMHFVDLNGFNDLGAIDLNVDVDGVFVRFQPDGESVFVKHGLTSQPASADYTLIDLCAAPRLGSALSSSVGGVLFDLSGDPTISKIEQPAGSGDFVARIQHPDIGGVDIPLTPCSGAATGACCDGGCIVTDQGSCGGTFIPGASCTPDPCAAPGEGCCFGDGTCRELAPAACISSNGTPQGSGSDCSTAMCTESCCIPSTTTCFDVGPTLCTNAGGTTGGPGSDCTTRVCQAPMLTVSKSCPANVQAGEDYACTITYQNTGTLDAQNVVVSETIPLGAVLVSAGDAPNGTPATVTGGKITWNAGTLPAQTFNQQVTFTLTASCSASQIVNANYLISGNPGFPAFGLPVTTNVTAASSAPIDMLISSIDANGPPLKEDDLIEHTITLTNTDSQPRRGVTVRSEFGGDISTGYLSRFDSVIDAAGGGVTVSANSTGFRWTGDLGPNATVDIVVTTRLPACVPTFQSMELLNQGAPLTVRNACNAQVGTATPADLFTLYRPVTATMRATNLSEPTVRNVVNPGSRFQLARAGSAVEFEIVLENQDNIDQPNVAIELPVPPEFMVADPPFVGTPPTGTSYDDASRTISFFGNVPAGNAIVIAWEGMFDSNGCVLTMSATGQTAGCQPNQSNIASTLSVYQVPELPTQPHLVGTDPFRGFWTFTPDVDSESQELFCLHGEIYGSLARRDNQEIWVTGLPTVRFNPDTLECELFDYEFFASTIGFAFGQLPAGVAYDPADDTLLFSGVAPAGSTVVRYNPDTHQVTTLLTDPAIGTGQCLVDLEGQVVIQSGSALHRIDPTDPLNFTTFDYSLLPIFAPPEFPITSNFVGDITLDVDGDYLLDVESVWLGTVDFEYRRWLAKLRRDSGTFEIVSDDVTTLGLSVPNEPVASIAINSNGVVFFAQQALPSHLYQIGRSCGLSASHLGIGGPSGFPGDYYVLRDMVAHPPVRTLSATTARLMGDFDDNCLIDLIDHAHLVDCFSGPADVPAPTPPIQPGDCLAVFDFDASGTIDLRDFAGFSRALADSTNP